MSGAGKSTALRTFEDLGYFCIDNLPPELIETFMQLQQRAGESGGGIAVVCDVRSGEMFGHLRDAIILLEQHHYSPEVLFFDCAENVLVKRFNESRRVPPLGVGLRTLDAVRLERSITEPVRDIATHIIDTTDLSATKLKERILKLYGQETQRGMLQVTLLSFGFKYGIPPDADFVFDTRFLPNPFYVDELRPQTGNDAAVRDHVLANPLAVEYIDRIEAALDAALPHYSEVHKLFAVVAIGCTGGRHRSVTLANALAERLERKGGRCLVQHRDVDRAG
jgi:UPF0042 nucleotide-binding protein